MTHQYLYLTLDKSGMINFFIVSLSNIVVVIVINLLKVIINCSVRESNVTNDEQVFLHSYSRHNCWLD